MKKKPGIYRWIFVLTAFLMGWGTTLSADNMTLTTYYASPYGAYDQLRLVPRATIAATACDAGTLYFSSDDGQIYFCNATDADGEWGGLGGSEVWTQAGDDIYLSDTANSTLKFVGIGTEDTVPIDFKLTLKNDGGILAQGICEYPDPWASAVALDPDTATLTTAGAGTRLIWYPKKASLRAGRVSGGGPLVGAEWDDVNIQSNSFAFGLDNLVSTDFSIIGGGELNQAIGTGSAVVIGGGLNNVASVERCGIGGGRNNTCSWNRAAVGGGFSNTASSTNATVCGGQSNRGQAGYAAMIGGDNNVINGGNTLAVISGGRNNATGGTYTTVSGGANNTAGAQYATVSGGQQNTISNTSSTISGGQQNSTTAQNVTISGGLNNQANANYAVIGGGRNHLITGTNSTIAGGDQNNISTTYSLIAGGNLNAVSSASHGTILGGASNAASGQYAFIGSGLSNAVSGTYSSILGGESNSVSSTYSLAMGRNLNVTGTSIFGWGYNSTTPIALAQPNSFIISTGSVGIGTTAPAMGIKLHLVGNAAAKDGIIKIGKEGGASYSLIITADTVSLATALKIDSTTKLIGKDAAEVFAASEEVSAGDVLVIDPANAMHLKKSGLPYDKKVVGIVSEAPAILLEGEQMQMSPDPAGVNKPNRPAVALAGRVLCKVSTENGEIQPGDLLTTSSVAGHAMKADRDRAKSLGKIVGKALESFSGGANGETTGMIAVFVTLQ